MDIPHDPAPSRDWRTWLVGLGTWRAILVITALCILASVILTAAISAACGINGLHFWVGIVIGTVVPMVVAPAAVYFILQLVFELEDARADLLHLATHDGLTSIYNRRYFVSHLESESQRSRRTGDPLSLVMIDVDHFKSINDRHGHAAGDRVLQEIAHASVGILRAYDVLARFGGEEFVALMPNVLFDEACAAAERIRAAISTLRVEVEPGLSIGVTVSLGVSTGMPPAHDGADLLSRADAALYEAKRSGRNRVAASPLPDTPQLAIFTQLSSVSEGEA